MDIKVGDTVYMHGVVASTDVGSCYIKIGDSSLWVNHRHIDRVERMPLKVGDKVTWGTGAEDWEIKCIDGSDAFLARDGTHIVRPLKTFRLVG